MNPQEPLYPVRWKKLMSQAIARGLRRVAVMWPCDAETLWALSEAAGAFIQEVFLVGQMETLKSMCNKLGISTAGFSFVDVSDAVATVPMAMELVEAGQADLLMSGLMPPDLVLRHFLDERSRLAGGAMPSAVSLLDAPLFERVVLVADPLIHVAPNLEEKADIVRHAVHVAHRVEITEPLVALLSATEVVNPKSPSSLHAAELSKMAQRGQISGCRVDGPLALDNAVSSEAAAIKGIVGGVAGRADVLICSDVESANMLVRIVTWVADAVAATVVVGGRCPIAMPSRSDTSQSKLASLCLGAALCG